MPSRAENRMRNEGNLSAARDRFFNDKPNNLVALLKSRYEWMNPYLQDMTQVYELGAGAGFSKHFVGNPNLKLTDVIPNHWIDQHVDALALPFQDDSVDAFICSHMIHHVAFPLSFLEAMLKALKPGGIIIVSEIYTSFAMKFLLRIMRHEGWSYKLSPFNREAAANKAEDPWSANCAIPEMLFDDKLRLEKELSIKCVVEKVEHTECLLFPLSGGVIARTPTVPLPKFLLRVLESLDSILVRLAPSFFAMGMRVVIRKL
jgi:SAM-dependent methyltransferase